MAIKEYLFLFFIVVLILGCSTNTSTENSTAETKFEFIEDTISESTINENLSFNTKKIVGSYIGKFGNTAIALNITYVGRINIVGYNIVNGLKRNIVGTYYVKDNKLVAEMKEAGTNQHDGIFNFAIDTSTLSLVGNWQPFNTNITSAKTLNLMNIDSSLAKLGIEYIYAMTFYLTKYKNKTIDENYDNFILLEKDGSFKLNYYKDIENKTAQQKSIYGNWQLIDTSFITLYMSDTTFFGKNKFTFHTTFDTYDKVKYFKSIYSKNFKYDVIDEY